MQLRGKQYVEINLRKLEKFERRQKHRQQTLITRFTRSEKRLKASLLGKDTIAWKRYNEQGLARNSILSLAKLDTDLIAGRSFRAGSSRLDSLPGVTHFLANATDNTRHVESPDQYCGQIDQLQRRLDYMKYIDDLIARRTAGLESISTTSNSAVRKMQKELYYAKARIKEYQNRADDPTSVEAKAYKFLRGQPGFEEQIDASAHDNNL